MLLKRLHTIYALTLLGITFLAMFPFFVVFGTRVKWHKYAYQLTNMWSKVFFSMALFKVEIEKHGQLSEGPFVFCANHFSYLDVPLLPYVWNNACFVGKSSIQSVPIFGYFFKTLHISVDRNSIRDRARALKRNRESINNGTSLFIFPEGGIKSVTPPSQAHYKDGAFVTAIDMQVPIVPVTIAWNWIALPDDGKFIVKSRRLKLIIHEPIVTENMSSENVAQLKERVYETIDNELIKQN